jgi:2-polyprenyl-3-methyl-5-hydroxy-6-metoxy-1,4-benzoquinol methylase
MDSINKLRNKNFYDIKYSKVNIKSIIRKLENLESFLMDTTRTDTSWVGLYHDNFQKDIKDKKILELGCGDCTNLAVMAALGADVYGNDISQKSGLIIEKLNENIKFKYPLKFIHGDFLFSSLKENEYDYVIGKAFVHHLTNDEEIQFTELIIKYLKPSGIVRYLEPAVNSKILDGIRWLTPVPGRPSKLQKNKFKQWKLNDPHPERDNSSYHYKKIGEKYFNKVNIIPIGSLERFCRLITSKYNRPLRRFSFKVEKLIPYIVNLKLARSQLIEYKYPKK